MSRGVNKIFLLGYVGKDPETRAMPSGDSVANLTLATSESWKDKQSGEQKERTEWHHLVFFGKRATIIAEYVKKGTQLFVIGKLQTRKWQDKEGRDRYTTEVVVDEFQMVGGKSAEGGTPRRESAKPAAATVAPEKAFEDDDIPF